MIYRPGPGLDTRHARFIRHESKSKKREMDKIEFDRSRERERGIIGPGVESFLAKDRGEMMDLVHDV